MHAPTDLRYQMILYQFRLARKSEKPLYIYVYIRQWPGRPEFDPSSRHTKDSKNGTLCRIAKYLAL